MVTCQRSWQTSQVSQTFKQHWFSRPKIRRISCDEVLKIMQAYVGTESSLHEAISPADFLKFLFVYRVRAFALVSYFLFRGQKGTDPFTLLLSR